MAENPGVHRVTFKNETPKTVTFVVETITDPQTAFTLKPKGFRNEEVHPLTHQTLRLVVGENSNGQYTNECVSTDELDGLDEVIVKWKETPGNNSVNNFVLKKTPRKTKKWHSVTRPWGRWSRSRNNKGAPSGKLDV